jgi:hypothetical protein
VDPILGSLVYQLPGGVTLAYDIRLGHTIARWKGIVNEIHLGLQLSLRRSIPKNLHLGPQNGPGS